MSFQVIFLLLIISLTSQYAIASKLETQTATTEQAQAKFYQNSEQRREVGAGRRLTDWLRVASLIELEKEYVENNFDHRVRSVENTQPQLTAEFAAQIAFSDWLNAELAYEFNYEFEKDQRQFSWDEVLLEARSERVDTKLGRLYLPFGEYYSRFITSPMLEFGETRSDGLLIDIELSDMLEVSTYAFESTVDRLDDSSNIDWGSSVEFNAENELFKLGIGYLSDLAESDEGFLLDVNRQYSKQVSAWNAYAAYHWNRFNLTAEFVRANNAFGELEGNANKPIAYNTEITYQPIPGFQLAFRYEWSEELSDQPERQYGLALAWQPGKHLTVALDYLYGDFQDDFVLDDDDNQQRNRQLTAIQIGLEF